MSESMFGSHAGLYDPATGLAKAPLFADRVQRALLLADREDLQVSLLMVKLIPARTRPLETAETRHVLGEIGARFQESVRISDSAGRLSADEYAILLPHALESGIPTVATRVRDLLAEPVELPIGSFAYSPCVGVVTGAPRTSYDHLMLQGREAMETAHRQGGGIVVYGSPGIARAA